MPESRIKKTQLLTTNRLYINANVPMYLLALHLHGPCFTTALHITLHWLDGTQPGEALESRYYHDALEACLILTGRQISPEGPGVRAVKRVTGRRQEDGHLATH